MSIPTNAVNLAKYVVNKCIDDNCPISNLQLQKILYYIQKEFLQNGKIAFTDAIEAWQFGPVVPNAYYNFCGFGAMPITIIKKEEYDFEDDDIQTINKIVEEKRQLNPWDLVEDTHKPGGAWYQTYQDGVGNHKVIPTELIKAVG